MALTKADLKQLIKRTDIPGVTASIGPSLDFTDGTWTQEHIYPGEFMINLGVSGTASNEVLFIGTNNGVRNIPLVNNNIGDVGEVLINLGDGICGWVDPAGITASSVIGGNGLTKTDSIIKMGGILTENTTIDSDGYTFKIYTDDSNGTLIIDNDVNYVLLALDGEAYERANLYLDYTYGSLNKSIGGKFIGFNIYNENNTVGFDPYSTGISIKENTTNAFRSIDEVNPAIIIGSRNSTVNVGVDNSVIIGGVGLTASENNTVYVDKLNINTVGTGTASSYSLSIDNNKNIVKGFGKYSTSTALSGSGFDVITHNLNTRDIIVQVYNENDALITPVAVEITGVNTVDIEVSYGETYRIVIFG